MNNLPKQLHLNVQLDDSISLDRFINCDSTKDFLSFLSNAIDDRSISNFYLIWGNEGRGKSYVMHGLQRKFLEEGKKTFHFSFKKIIINNSIISSI